jgi:hypothetical protein
MGMPALAARPQKISLGDMRDMGVRGLLIYCQDFHCSHSTAISANQWPDDVRLSDIEPLFVCQACGKRGGDVRSGLLLEQEAGRGDGLPVVPWSARFHDPIQPPKGKSLVTLKDAADYIMRLPKKVHDAPHWQLAMEQLIDAAEGRNFITHARIAVLKALNHGEPEPKTEPRRKAVKKYGIVR